MRRYVIFGAVGLLVILVVLYIFSMNTTPQKEEKGEIPSGFRLSSPAFGSNAFIPEKYTCDGIDINPPLEISGVPVDAQSLALIMDDPDAPGGVWVHWLVWNIRPDTTVVREGVVLPAVYGLTSFGDNTYGGPCPPSGTHRYFFKLYALDTEDLGLEIFTPPFAVTGPAEGTVGNLRFAYSSEKKPALEKAMRGHIVGEAELVGLYRRK